MRVKKILKLQFNDPATGEAIPVVVIIGCYYEVWQRRMPRDRNGTSSLMLELSKSLTAVDAECVVTTVTMQPYYHEDLAATARVFLVNRYEHFPRYTQWFGSKDRLIVARRCVPLNELEEQVVVRILNHKVDEETGLLRYQVVLFLLCLFFQLFWLGLFVCGHGSIVTAAHASALSLQLHYIMNDCLTNCKSTDALLFFL